MTVLRIGADNIKDCNSNMRESSGKSGW